MSLPETSPPELYAKREPIFPRRVQGRFRSAKWWIMAVTLGIYYLTPWIRWDRGAALPDQAVLVDIAGRRFFFFMIEIWPHEFYFVAGLLIMAGLGLFLFTSALGRVWCGYACPQTVWTDLFILVERWIEGDRNARLRLHRSKWTVEKISKRAVKWLTWLVIGFATGGAWIFYFTDAPTLLRDLIAFNAHPVAWITMLLLTMTTFIFGGFMREQICIYACPWPRIQAAMMDEETITIAYRDWRGEPRGKAGLTGTGDCIDCKACVNVCPMGIDIREGQQLACITCGLCIDACDDIMARIGKPRGLIDYLALTDEKRERAGDKPIPAWRHVLRPRTILYTTLWAGVGVALIAALVLRGDIDVSVTPLRNPTYVTLSDGTIRNTYDIRLRNMDGEERRFSFTARTEHGEAAPQLAIEGEADASVAVSANATAHIRLYLSAAPGSHLAGAPRSGIEIMIEAQPPGGGSHRPPVRVTKQAVFNGRGG